MKIDIYLTENCNLRCRYCYLQNKRPLNMSRKTLFCTIDYFLNYQSDSYYITFIGGEPTLGFDQIKEAARYIKVNFPQKKILYNIVTNGIALNKQRLSFMKKNKFSAVLSLDGCKEAQDTHRIFKNGTGSFRFVERNIDDIKNYIGSNRLFVRMTITPETVIFFKKSLQYFMSMGFVGIGFVPTFEVEWSKENLKIFEDVLRWFLDEWEDMLRKRDLVVLPFSNYLIHNENPKYIFHYFMHPCQLGSERFSVDVKGNIYPCHRFVSFDRVNRKYILGNVLHNKNKVYFKIPKFTLSKKKLDTFGCMAVNYDENKNALKPLKNYKIFYNIYQRLIKRSKERNPELIPQLKKRKYDSLQWKTKFYDL